MGTRIMIYGARASYLQSLWTPQPFEQGDTPAWSGQFILDPADPKQAKQIEAYEAAEKEEFRKVYEAAKGKPELFEKAWAALGPTDRGLRDGDYKGTDEYAGKMFIAARATQGKQAAPVVLDRRAARVAEGAEGAPYSGCFVNAQIEIWAQYGKYKRVNATLLGVQFVRDGDAFGGGKPADLSAFQPLDDTGDEDDGEDLGGLA